MTVLNGVVFPRKGRITVHDTSVLVMDETIRSNSWDREVWKQVWAVNRGILGRLRFRGWKVQRDPDTVKNYPTLAPGHWVGSKGDLKLSARADGYSIKYEFFQDRDNVSHMYGGKYEYNKFEKMPRDMRLMCVIEMANVIRKMVEYGYTEIDRPNGCSLTWAILCKAEGRKSADPLELFNEHWNDKLADGTRRTRFARDESGWPTLKEYAGCSNNLDRDKRPMFVGDTVYWRENGRLMRGVAYPNMGNMWCVHSGIGVNYHAGFRLYQCERPNLEPRRLVPKQLERLTTELEKATKEKDFRRAAAIATAAERLQAKTKEQS